MKPSNTNDLRVKDGQLSLFRAFIDDYTQTACVFNPRDVVSFRANAYLISKSRGIKVISRTIIVLPSMRNKVIMKKLNFTPIKHPDTPYEDPEHQS